MNLKNFLFSWEWFSWAVEGWVRDSVHQAYADQWRKPCSRINSATIKIVYQEGCMQNSIEVPFE